MLAFTRQKSQVETCHHHQCGPPAQTPFVPGCYGHLPEVPERTTERTLSNTLGATGVESLDLLGGLEHDAQA